MQFSLTDLFCELVSGIAVLLGVAGFLSCLGVLPLEQLVALAAHPGRWPSAVFVLTVAYVAGLVADAFGITFDKHYSSKVCTDSPADEQKKAFWQNAAKHVVEYRDRQWAYYSLYRNLFLVTLVGGVAWLGISFSRWGFWGLSAGTIVWAILLLAFWTSMRDLLSLYYKITIYIDREMTGSK